MVYHQSTGYDSILTVNCFLPYADGQLYTGVYRRLSVGFSMLSEQVIERLGYQLVHGAVEADCQDLQAVPDLLGKMG